MHTLNYNLVLNDPSPNRTLTLDVPLFQLYFVLYDFLQLKFWILLKNRNQQVLTV